MISVFPRNPAIARERIAVGTLANDCTRMISPKPGNSRASNDNLTMNRSHAARVTGGAEERQPERHPYDKSPGTTDRRSRLPSTRACLTTSSTPSSKR